MAKKKILIFSLDYLPGTISGAESAIQDITDRISPEEIEFHMVTMYYNSDVPRVGKYGNVTCHYVGLFGRPDPSLEQRKKWPLHVNKYYFQFAAGIKGWWLHRTYQYDGAWAMMAHGAGVPTVIFNFLTGVPFAVSLQEGDPPEHIERIARPVWPLFKRAFTHATVVQAISDFLAAWGKRMGYPREIPIIRDGANPGNLKANFSTEEAEAVKKKLGKKEGDVYILIAARLVHQKAVDVVIKAMKLLPPHVYFVIVGGGPDEEALKQLAKDEGVAERVKFLGQIEREEVPKYRNRIVADIFVHPSRSEGLGHTNLSAMAGYLPVVATQVGGMADFIFDEQRNPDKPTTAWAVDPESPEQIAAAVEDIMAHPEKVREVTERARKMVEDEYDWDKITVRMKQEVFEPLFNVKK